MSNRKIWFVATLILINLAVCLLWVALIRDNPQRAPALIVLLPLQATANLFVISIINKFRLSALTVILVLGLVFGLFTTFRTREWWALIYVPFSLGLIIGSVKMHRRSIQRIKNDGTEE